MASWVYVALPRLLFSARVIVSAAIENDTNINIKEWDYAVITHDRHDPMALKTYCTCFLVDSLKIKCNYTLGFQPPLKQWVLI